tara:strand:+ start:559 stop:2493 length:1935 start_codon:yes stop_codon:yes gene_type:complete
VADYSVNLELAIKGAKDLQRTRVETKALQKEIDIFNKRVRQAFPASVKNFNNLSKEVGRAHKAVSEAAIGTDHYRVAIKNAVKVEEQFNKQQSNKAKLFKIERMAYKEGISFSQAKAKVIQEEIKAENELAKARLRSSGIGAGIRRGVGSAVGSGIIGGGFPLLFGQGPLAAAAGGIGGAAGGALAAIPGMGQFGFALSIAGTAIGSAMEDLTQALKKPEDNIQNLVNKLGLVGTPTEELALRLEKMGLKSSAARLLLDQFNEKMGTSPEEILETTKKLTEFKNKINELGTEITLFLTGVLGPFIDAIAGSLDTGKMLRMLKQQEGIENFGRVQREIVLKANQRAAAQFKTNQAMGVKDAPSFTQLRDQNIDVLLRERLGIKESDFSNVGMNKGNLPDSNLATQTFQDREIQPLKQALQIEQNRLTMSSEKLTLMKETFELQNLLKELNVLENEAKQLNNGLHDDAIEKLKAEVNLQQEVVSNARKLADPFRQLSQIIEVDIGNGIKGLIKGTSTLGDMLNNVLNKLTDALLNMAIFGNFGGGSVTGGLLGLFGFANGGRPPVGRPSVVGERGPELFVPDRAGTIIPNHQLGGMGGSTNIVVNVDASGSNVQGNGEDSKALGLALSAAIETELIKQKRPGGLLA